MKKDEIVEILKEEFQTEVPENMKKSDLEDLLKQKQEEKESEEPEKEEKKSSGFVVKNMTKRKRNVCEFSVAPMETQELTKEQFESAKVQHGLKNKRLKRV